MKVRPSTLVHLIGNTIANRLRRAETPSPAPEPMPEPTPEELSAADRLVIASEDAIKILRSIDSPEARRVLVELLSARHDLAAATVHQSKQPKKG